MGVFNLIGASAGLVNTLVVIGAVLVVIFTILVILLYLRSHSRSRDAVANQNDTGKAVASGDVDAFEKRNDNRNIMVNTYSENQQFNANEKYNNAAAELEEARISLESERAQLEAERVRWQEDQSKVQQQPAIANTVAAAPAAATAGFSNDFFNQLDQTSEQQASTGGDAFAFQSMEEKQDDVREGSNRADERRADRERRRADREAKKNPKTNNLFVDPDEGAPAFGAFGAESAQPAAAKNDAFGAWGEPAQTGPAPAQASQSPFFVDDVQPADDVFAMAAAAPKTQEERTDMEALVEGLRRENEQKEEELRRQYEVLQQQIEEQSQAAIRQNEEIERQLKEQYEAYKLTITTETRELEEKNRELLAEVERVEAKAQAEIEAVKSEREKSRLQEIEQERIRITEQLREEFEQNEKVLSEKYMKLRNEMIREHKQIEEQSEELAREMEAVRRQKEALAQASAGNREDFESEKARLAEQLEIEKAKLEKQLKEERERNARETERMKAEIEATGKTTVVQTVVDVEEVERLRQKLQRDYEENEHALKVKYEQMQTDLARETRAIESRRQELVVKEEQLTLEETRILKESREVHTLITERSYTTEERNRILADYRVKIEELRERLRVNEKSIRDNNKEYVPLRRIKDTLDRDLRLLRKREAVVAKQQVLVYGVNNITSLDPERVKKLEQDVKQLTGLQQSVANCEEILNKNKDRYPTLVSLDKVLKSQNSQLLRDIEEMQGNITFFESYVPGAKKN